MQLSCLIPQDLFSLGISITNKEPQLMLMQVLQPPPFFFLLKIFWSLLSCLLLLCGARSWFSMSLLNLILRWTPAFQGCPLLEIYSTVSEQSAKVLIVLNSFKGFPLPLGPGS